MQQTVFTIGHSTHEQEHFVKLLSQHGITAVGDVRSKPFSRVNPQFNRNELNNALREHGIKYIFLGKELGARTDDRTCYKDGKVQYDLLARTTLFRNGLARIQDGIEKGFRIALMCAEKEPLECHRTILVSRHLAKAGLQITHIHADGKLETQADALKRLAFMLNLTQGEIFDKTDEAFADVYRRQEERIAYKANNAVEPVETQRVGSATE
ncbi:MAG TPA: DUF488 domain-containing protein [Bryobacteraceae bacterium]|jgi:uncharacterized protein (DUF488 family)|nr:DUF488 domain-containing protein [Bryobacteraceae bacterium]